MHWSYKDVQLQSVASRFCGHFACFIVFSEVVVTACVVLSVVLLVTLVLTMFWCMDLYVCNKCDDIRFFVIFISTTKCQNSDTAISLNILQGENRVMSSQFHLLLSRHLELTDHV